MKKRIIFIGGCPRSGTTMLGSILGSTKYSLVTPESHFKQRIPISLRIDWSKGIDKEEVIKLLSKDFKFRLWEIQIPVTTLAPVLSKNDYRELILKLVDSYAKKVGKIKWDIWVDHTPQNFQNALTLLDIFPDSKFVHIIRDPRAVAASVIPLNWGPNHAEDAAKYWAQKISFALAFKSNFPEKYLEVKYEDVVRYPEKTIKQICDFNGLKFSDSMISGKDFRVPDHTKSQHALVGKTPDSKRIDSWRKKLSDLEIYQIERYLEDLLDMMGYIKIYPKPVRNIIQRIIIRLEKGQITRIIKKRKVFRRKQIKRQKYIRSKL